MEKLMLVMVMVWCAGVLILLVNHWHKQSSSMTSIRNMSLPVWMDDTPWLNFYLQEVERHRIFFLNVHNTGGDIVRDVLLRYAKKNNRTVLLPRTPFVFSHTGKDYWNNTDPRAWERTNDILCDYMVFNERFTALLMPRDTLYIAIVHAPFQRLAFTFRHYTANEPQPYLTNITGPYQVATYLDDPTRWEHPDPSQSFTNNRMTFDFGLEPHLWRDKRAVRRYTDYLEKRFDLVMVGDKLDESLVLLKRLAGWPSLQTVIYVRPNQWEVTENYVFNETQRNNFRSSQYPDYYLYHRFSNLLNKKMALESDDGFYEEVAHFKDVLDKLKLFCEQHMYQDDAVIKIKKSEWNEQFDVAARDCQQLTGRLPSVNWTTLELIRD